MISLRDYQEELLEKAREQMRQKMRNILLCLQTGGGKTVIAAFLAKAVTSRSLRIWFICHRNFLLHQTSLTFDQVGIEHGFIAAGRKYQDKPVMICSIDTLKNRLEALDPPDVLIWDEAHHVKAAGWELVRAWAKDAYNLGLTATPERLDGKGLKPPFDVMVEGPSTRWLIEHGFLSTFRPFCPTTIDRTALADTETAGDYNSRAMEDEVRQKVIVGDVIGWFKKLTEGRAVKAIYFCPSIAYSRELALAFSEAGIPARHIDGDTPLDERLEAAKALATGEIMVLTNCALLGEGYDLSAQAGMDVTIDVVGQLRPTMSLALHRQQLGRGLRPKPYPCLLIDHVGNIGEHGTPSEEIAWSLDGRVKKKKGSTPMKTCPECFAAVPTNTRTCPECGHIFEVEPVEAVDGVLEELPDDHMSERRKREIKKARRDRIARCRTLDDFREVAKELGYARGWAFHAHARYLQDQAEADARAQQQYEYYRR